MSKQVYILDNKTLKSKKFNLKNWKYSLVKFIFIFGALSLLLFPILIFWGIKYYEKYQAINITNKELMQNALYVEKMKKEIELTQAQIKKLTNIVVWSKAKENIIKENRDYTSLISNEYAYFLEKDNFEKNDEKILTKELEYLSLLEKNQNEKKISHEEFNLIWPTKGIITAKFFNDEISTAFHHTGVDIAASLSTPIISVDDGIVEKVDWNDLYGNYIVINHNNKYKTVYGHLSRVIVNKNKKIKQSDTIGFVGSTGKSTGPHLHFEILLNGVQVDPLMYLL